MPTIYITIDDRDEAIDAWANCAHRYGIVNVHIIDPDPDPENNELLESVDYVETDPTPPHGTPRPTTTPTRSDGADIRDMIRKAVNCRQCGANPAWPCHSKSGQNYPDFIHQARIDTWNNLDD